MSDRSAQGLWEGPPSHVAHQLPGDAASISSIETLSPRPERPSFASMQRQYVSGLLHQPPRGSSLTPPVQAGAADPLVDQSETALLEGSFHPCVPQSGSRHPVETGAEAWGMDAPHRGGGADFEKIWESPGRLVCISRDHTMSPSGSLWLIQLHWVCGPGRPPRRLSMGDSRTTGSPFSGRGALYVTLTQSCWSCGCGPWGGTPHSIWSLNRGCWDHPTIQSSHYEIVICC